MEGDDSPPRRSSRGCEWPKVNFLCFFVLFLILTTHSNVVDLAFLIGLRAIRPTSKEHRERHRVIFGGITIGGP